MPEQSLRLGVYVKSNGRSPFKDWVLGLKDVMGRAAVYHRLDRLAQGNPGDSTRLGSIYELRLHQGPGYRIYFGQDGPLLVVLLVGGDKSTQSRDIKSATEHWNDYQNRKAEALAPL
jgi:putative addiction module killer protein